jgi:hypothetical protein
MRIADCGVDEVQLPMHVLSSFAPHHPSMRLEIGWNCISYFPELLSRGVVEYRLGDFT